MTFVRASAWLKGSVILALPFVFSPSLNASTRTYKADSLEGGVEAGATTLYLSLAELTASFAAAGYPQPLPQSVFAYGGGAFISRPNSRYIFQAYTASSSLEASPRTSAFNLDMVGVCAEQRYPQGSLEWLAGFAGYFSVLALELRDTQGAFTRFDARNLGGGVHAGLRWPSQSRLCFTLRSGYLWLMLPGAWRGTQALSMSKSAYDLSSPYAQAGVQVSF